MNIVILTNDNFFSFTVLKGFLELRKNDIKLIVFSSALIGKRSTVTSIKWSLANTGLRHTVFKLMIYGVFRAMKIVCKFLPFIANHYSSYLWAQRNNVTSVVSSNINDAEVVEQIRDSEPDLIASVSMNQIVKKQILEMQLSAYLNAIKLNDTVLEKRTRLVRAAGIIFPLIVVMLFGLSLIPH